MAYIRPATGSVKHGVQSKPWQLLLSYTPNQEVEQESRKWFCGSFGYGVWQTEVGIVKKAGKLLGGALCRTSGSSRQTVGLFHKAGKGSLERRGTAIWTLRASCAV